MIKIIRWYRDLQKDLQRIDRKIKWWTEWRDSVLRELKKGNNK